MVLQKFRENALFGLLALFSFLVFAPVFFTQFGFHSDYSFLLVPPGKVKIFIQWKLFLESGRILGGLATTVQSWFINSVSDLAIWRLIAFLTQVLTQGLFVRYLHKRFGLEMFWCGLIAFSMMMLPSNQLSIFWVADFVPGIVTVILAILSYRMLDEARILAPGRRAKLKLFGSAVIFLAALFIYPPMAMFVFTLSFADLIFTAEQDVRKIQRRIIGDILFYGILMAVYFVVNWFWVTIPELAKPQNPLFPHKYWYKVAVTDKLFGKFPLIWDTFVVSLAGAWHLWIGKAGAFVTLAICIVCLWLIRKTNKAASISIAIVGYKILLGSILFLIASSPLILAPAITAIVGYRVLLATTSMALLLQFALLSQCERQVTKEFQRASIKIAALVLVVSSGLVAQYNVTGTLQSHKREYDYIRARVAALDFTKIKRITGIMIPQYHFLTVIDRPLPLEFSYMLTSIDHLGPILDDELKKQGVSPIPFIFLELEPEDVVYYDENTEVIDINDLRFGKQAENVNHQRAFMSFSKNYVGDMHAIPLKMQDRSMLFRFIHEVDGKKNGYWEIKRPAPWMQIEFLEKPQRLIGLKIKGLIFYPHQQQYQWIYCEIQASNDGKNWETLDAQRATRGDFESGEQAFNVKVPAFYRYYRFNFPQFPSGTMWIESIMTIF